MTATIGRRAALIGAALLPATRSFAQDDKLVSAAKAEGTLVWHSSIDLEVCEAMIGGFNKHYPDIKVQLERTGAERILQRINQEYASNIFVADVVESSDTGTFYAWKQSGWMAQFLPPDVAKWPAEERDPGGRYASIRASMATLAYNTRQIKPEDTPKSFADLLSPKWRMRLVKSHPSYSGAALTATYALVKALGWDWFVALQKQRVMQVQSATEPPKKVAQGERPVMVDGAEYVALNLEDAGEPIKPLYASEGTPLYSGSCCVMAKSPHPNAARLFSTYLFSQEGQQLMVNTGNLRSFHPDVTDKPGHVPLKDIKLLRVDAEDLAQNAEAVKKKYSEIFGV